jgi:hypothetical protein
MTFKGWTVAAGLVLLARRARAARRHRSKFRPGHNGRLGRALHRDARQRDGDGGRQFCEGFAQGAVSVEMQNMAAFRGPKPFCMPNPPPSRSEALGEFVKWAQVSPDRMSATSTDGLFRFLSERYPCPPSR